MRTRKSRMLTKTVLAVAGLALTSAGVVACGNDDDATSSDEGESSSETTPADDAADDAYNDADVEFTKGMIPHHAQAVDMSAMVADRSDSPDLVALAKDIEAAQQPEIDLMTGMLEEWGEEVPDAGMEGHGSGMGGDDSGDGESGQMMEGMMSESDMADMQGASGKKFDRMWLNMMIEHHEGAITMSETVMDEGSNEDVKELAKQIIDVQQKEIEKMQGMLNEGSA